MNDDTPRHLWIRAPTPAAREALLAAQSLPAGHLRVDAHRRLRGPYSAAGSLIRMLVCGATTQLPDIVADHGVEILTVAAELRGTVPCLHETLTSMAPPQERTRFYAPARTTRIAHGLVELVDGLLAPRGRPCTLVVDNASQADPTDVEWLAILLRRSDPAVLRVVVCSDLDPGSEQLSQALASYAVAQVSVGRGATSVGARPEGATSLAARYVASECLSGEPGCVEAYESLSVAARAALHDARADELEGLDEVSLRLGAIPFHRERGSDPEGAGASAVLHALQHCMLMGFYDAVIDLSERAAALLDWDTRPAERWLTTAKATTALATTGRVDEAEALYDDACAHCSLPDVHLQAAYGRAMLHTRFATPERRDHMKAKAYINTAIALSQGFPSAQRRAFHLTFNENGLALIEMHLGDAQKALALVEAGLARLDADIERDEQSLHRSVLRHNRAQLLARLGRLPQSLAEYDRLVALDPNHSEYYFERANIHRKLGSAERAIADYGAAIDVSPPYPEPHYNRADLAAELGDVESAIADYAYVLELDPGFSDARLNRASLLLELGDVEGARRDVEQGLSIAPDGAHLHALLAQIAQHDGRVDDAHQAFDTALRLDPTLVAAWSNRAVLWFEQGEIARAIDDLTTALTLREDPDIRANRALAYEAAGRLIEAAADRPQAAVALAGE